MIDDSIAGLSPPDDSSGEERLFAAHYLPVMRLCLRRLRDVDDAEDAVQEVFRRAVQHSADLHDDPLPWLITVAKHVCLDELRRRRSGRVLLERSADAAVADSAERVVVGHMFVRELLGRLTPAERRVLGTHVYGTGSSADTAELLGVSSSTTRVLLARARQKLRAYLESGQANLGAAPLMVTRTLHAMRRRLFERAWFGEQASAAVLIPAAALMVVGMNPGVSGSATRGDAGHGTDATAMLHRGATWSPEDAPAGARHSFEPGSAVAIATRNVATPTQVRPGPFSGHFLIGPIQPGFGPNQASDVQPSPTYSSDHTLYMLTNTPTSPNQQLWSSTDGAVTWKWVGATTLTERRLVLPETTAQGRFYVFGDAGLEMTTTGGASFVAVPAPVGGYAVAAPFWSGLGVVLSDRSLWRVEGTTVTPLALFPPGEEAVSPPVFLHGGPSGYQVLQAVQNTAQPGPTVTSILRCTPACQVLTTLPFATIHVNLVPSPTESTDHTIFALAVSRTLAISHDDGASFAIVRSAPIMDMTAVTTSHGRRLIATMVDGAGVFRPAYSDDDGTTWNSAPIDPVLKSFDDVETVTVVDGRFVASIMLADPQGYLGFACSADGSAWSRCSGRQQ